jgi:hypothetical protein
MNKNRLRLDWSITQATDRSRFINDYVQQKIFREKAPTEEELETMANYVLWGQDADGKNPDQRKEIELPRRQTTWAPSTVDSLDEHKESPTFSEASVHKLGTVPVLKKAKTTFSRSETRKTAPDHLLPLFEELWERIDYIDLIIGLYEERTGKRSGPPREELLRRTSTEILNEARAVSETLNQRTYLKKKHELVELRREQYTLRDAYAETKTLHQNNKGTPEPVAEEERVFGEEIPVFPLGLVDVEENVESGRPKIRTFWVGKEELVPENFSEEEKKNFSKIFWEKQKEKQDIDRRENGIAAVDADVESANPQNRWFDFRELEMVYQLLLFLQEIDKDKQYLLQNTSKLVKTLFYYIGEADLNEVQREILDMKIGHTRNQDIAISINKKYGKSYTTNYISTIFRQKIIPEINQAAVLHAQLVESLPFEEEFKKCSCCGRTLLRDPVNFVRKSRAKDGLSNRCKKCDKMEREKSKK